jgi:phenylacetate-CoA ligase
MLNRLYWTAISAWHAQRDLRVPWWPLEKVLLLQQRRLGAMVRFAYGHVPFYREEMRKLGLRPEDIRTADDLALLPILTKQEVGARPERFRAPQSVLRAALRIQSSGTSGHAKYIDYDARALFLSLAAGQRMRAVMAPFVGANLGYREAAIARSGSVSTQLREFYERHSWTPRRVDLSRLILSPADPFEVLLARVNDFRPDVLRGYGSHLGAFLRWIHMRQAPSHRPRAVAYGADGMPERDRRLIEQEMGIPVFSNYQAVEALRLAYQCEQRRGLHIHIDHVAVRVVDRDGRTLPAGVPGEIVISNLTNRATVLLNYRLGDVVTLGREPCPCGRSLPTLDGIQGRDDDLVLLPGGSVAHPLSLLAVLQKIPGVIQVQLVQEELRRFLLRAACAAGADWRAVAAQLDAAMRSALGPDILLRLEPCERIEPGPSGKVRAVISLCRD